MIAPAPVPAAPPTAAPAAQPNVPVTSPNLRPEAVRTAALARPLTPDALPPPEGQQPPAPPVPAPGGQERPEPRPPRWLPQPGDLLPVLPPVDLRALEHALRGFIEELARAGEDLAGPEQARGLWPWIVAVAAAALGLEIARRRLRARARLPADEAPWSPGDPPGGPREESSP
jgi:hypothetical protein